MDLTPLVKLLPAALQTKAKAVAAAVLAVLTVVGTILPLVTGLPTWVSVVLGSVLAAATSISTYATPAPGYVGPPVEYDPKHDGTTELPAAD